MYALIDINRGIIFYCECYVSAIALRNEIKLGVIFNLPSPFTQYAIDLARATWQKGGQQ